MKREIKFRAWDNGLKVMRRWENMYDAINYVSGGARLFFKNDDMILMQYTGLKDKNGKEIYEGDILSVYSSEFVVRWDEFKGGFGLYEINNRIYNDIYMMSNYLFSVVIGNIYENPELLNSEPNVQECDASKAEQGTNADNQKKQS